MKLLVLIAVLLAVYTNNAYAESESQKPPSANAPGGVGVMVYSPGTVSCGVWLDARQAADKNQLDIRIHQFDAYLLGFATAFNYYAIQNGTRDILGNTDHYAARFYLDNYCRNNPTDTLVHAIQDLMLHLQTKKQ